ncbi:MAG: SpoIIE family protein phosphatase, partial [Gammaproteobacteria bacterium]|nr:SpoIIE family protein phosphatase [Gammaproteobacteria bacterium]
PGHNVGGDLYDVVPIGDRWVAIVIADTAGHGISAAMLAALFMHRLQLTDRQTGRPFRPTEALATINTALIKDLAAPGVFVTAVFCLLDTETRQLVVASAGHPPVLIARADGRVEQIEHTGPALGLYHDSVFGERTVHLNERDQVLLYTDGLFDVAGEIATSRDDIANTLRERQGQPRLLETVLVDVSSGSEREDRDDVTMVLLDASPGRSSFYDSGNAHALAPPDTDQQAVTFAETDDTTFLCLSGRMTWTHGEALLDAASEVVDNDRALIIDLAECEYLDSAMLGTLHELASRAAVAQTSFHVQNASASLKNAFEELSMHIVLERLSAQSVEVPQQRTALQLPPTDPHRQQMRLLAAHEVLADLSEDNQAQFGPVVDAMREDLGR